MVGKQWGKNGNSKQSGGWLLVAAGLLLPLVCGLVFFWPDRTIPYVDDLFFIPWAAEFAQTGRHWNPLLAVQFPGLDTYHLQPRLHLILAGWFLSITGVSTATIVLYEYLCYVATNLVFVVFCLRSNLRTAAFFTPLVFAPMYVVSGFRLELTGSFIWMLGLLLLLPMAAKAVSGDRRQTGGETAASIAGTALLGIAPLTALSMLAWSVGVIAVLQIWRLKTRQASVVRVVSEGMVALAIAATLFAVSVNFEFAEFFRQIAYHATRTHGSGRFNVEAVFRAAMFAGVAWFVFRKSRTLGLICFCLAAGQFLGAIVHDRPLIRNLAATMLFLLAVDTLLEDRWNKVKLGLGSALVLALSANFIVFYVFSKPLTNRPAVVEAYREDLKNGKRVFIDETMAHHFLDQQTSGALSWTWGGTFPKGRPTSMADLKEGDVWYVSEYTLLGYLKGRHDVAEKVWPNAEYHHVPQFSCILGRHSCNLPARRWTMMRLERLEGTVMATELGTGATPRPVEE
ncbi:hypothetical protein [Roseibium sp. LAB1]